MTRLQITRWLVNSVFGAYGSGDVSAPSRSATQRLIALFGLDHFPTPFEILWECRLLNCAM
jgi:hypothetical protein